LRTRTEGVVWLPDQAILLAGGNGFFRRWLVEPGMRVTRGAPLYELEDVLLDAEREAARAKVAEVEAQHRAEEFADPLKAAVLFLQVEREREVLRRVEERHARLVGYAETDGVVMAESPGDMPGRYFKKGDRVGYVLESGRLIARTVVTQDDIDLVRSRFRSAAIRYAELPGEAFPSRLARAVPGGVNELPTAALGMAGGGTVPTAPDDANGLRTLERVFLVDLDLPDATQPSAFGGRVHVRFDHGFEPLAWQGLRRLRQLFLGQFGV